MIAVGSWLLTFSIDFVANCLVERSRDLFRIQAYSSRLRSNGQNHKLQLTKNKHVDQLNEERSLLKNCQCLI